MGRIVLDTDPIYQLHDIVIFKINNMLHIGYVEAHYTVDENHFFNIRTAPDGIAVPYNGMDVSEVDIIGRVENSILKEKCTKQLTEI
jgi:hypothetical protein